MPEITCHETNLDADFKSRFRKIKIENRIVIKEKIKIIRELIKEIEDLNSEIEKIMEK